MNPWRTHSRFLVSHNLLIDAAYADPMREWLGDARVGSLLILDEAHHAAPSSSGRYGIETKFTRAVRDLAHRFEHRLFLSATPHNGHSNSFSTLLELLDPYRFTRGVKVRAKADLDPVMVRRLEEDLRSVQGGFPQRHVNRVEIAGLPEDAPELVLSRLLDEYRTARDQRYGSEPARARYAAALLTVGLQQRLLSSIEAFARSLQVHRHWDNAHSEPDSGEADGGDSSSAVTTDGALGFVTVPDGDDERSGWTPEEAETEEETQIGELDAASQPTIDPEAQAWQREQELLDEMQQVAEASRHLPGAKALRLIDWIRQYQCPGLPPYGDGCGDPPLSWTDRRVLIFTENREGTKRHLKTVLEHAIEGTDRAEERIGPHEPGTPPRHPAALQRRPRDRAASDPHRDGRGTRGSEPAGPLLRSVPF